MVIGLQGLRICPSMGWYSAVKKMFHYSNGYSATANTILPYFETAYSMGLDIHDWRAAGKIPGNFHHA